MGKGKKSKSGGPGPEVAECEAAVVAANEGHECVPVTEETLDAIDARHGRERAAVDALCSALGQSKPDKDKRMKSQGWLSQRHYEETRAWEDANEHADANDASTSEDGTDGDADALAKEVAAKASVTDAETTPKEPGGMTKAMKRRLKKEQEEREREERIEEEKANAGPSERDDEEKILNAILGPRGHALSEIKADGHCMYRAVEHQLTVRGDATPGDAGDEAVDYKSLRRMCADRLRSEQWDYRPFSDEYAVSTPESDAGWAKYCDDVEHTAVWGGQLELGALAKALKRSIKVFSARMPAVTMGEEFAGDSLLVCYQRHAFGLGEHYNSIVDV
jgi:OTU domain-containing protein 6